MSGWLVGASGGQAASGGGPGGMEAARVAGHANVADVTPGACTAPTSDIRMSPYEVIRAEAPSVSSSAPRPGIGQVVDRPVIAVRESPKPPPERLSLTRPVINASQRVWLVLAGADKASALGLALAGASRDEVPVAGIKGRRLDGFRLAGGAYRPIVPEERGWLWSEQLGLFVGLWQGWVGDQEAGWVRLRGRRRTPPPA